MTVHVLDDSLKIDIFIDKEDAEFDDDVCIRFTEKCPVEEKIFYGGETNIYITRAEAVALRDALQAVIDAD